MNYEIKNKLLEKSKELLNDESLSLSPLYGGNSLSENVCLKSKGGKLYTAKLGNKNQRMSRFELTRKLYDYGAAIANPIVEFDLGIENKFCTISEWIDGQTLDECIASNTYSVFGLAKMVCISISNIHKFNLTPSFRQILNQEIESYILFINEHGITFPHMDSYFQMIRNVKLQSFGFVGCTHMDFHTKNIIINTNGRAMLIDCENMMISEPWRDFVYAIAFHDKDENLFWFSVLLEYFEYSIPKEFWIVIKFYSIIQLLRMVICNYQMKDNCAIEKISESLFITYNGLKDCIPAWIKRYLVEAEQISNKLAEIKE